MNLFKCIIFIFLFTTSSISTQEYESENDYFSPVSKLNYSSLPLPVAFKTNNIKLGSIIDKSITLSCSINLDNVTFIIPLRIDSDDRLRNIIITTSYLLNKFDCKIIIKEYFFIKEVFPTLKLN